MPPQWFASCRRAWVYARHNFLQEISWRNSASRARIADMDVLPLRRPLTPRVAAPRAKDDDLVIPEELCETPPWPSSETLPIPPPAITPPNPPRASQVSDSRAQRSPHQPPVVIDALRSPAGPRSRSLERQSESFSRPSSPRCHSMTRRCGSFELAPMRGSSFDLSRAATHAVPQSPASQSRATLSSVQMSMPCHTPQRALVARAVSATSKTREMPKQERLSRPFGSIARLGGC